MVPCLTAEDCRTDLLCGVVHLGERRPAAAPGLAQSDRPVLYGGVVHWSQTPHL